MSDNNPRDPYIFFHEGKYYLLSSYQNCLWMKEADSIAELVDAPKQLVFVPDDEFSSCIWAPELHIINDKPYIYVTMAVRKGEPQHMFVLSTESSSIMGSYQKIGYLKFEDDAWAIDGTILHHDGKLYYIFSAFGAYDNEIYQALYIVEMTNPFTFKGEPVLLSKSDYDWEKHGCDGSKRPYVNEGPFALYHNKDTFIVYSASGCWTNYYCLGLLKFMGGDILDRNNWKKYDHPILDRSCGLNGPGHASFIQNDPSGVEYCAFHAFLEDDSRGEDYVAAYIVPIKWSKNTPVINIK